MVGKACCRSLYVTKLTVKLVPRKGYGLSADVQIMSDDLKLDPNSQHHGFTWTWDQSVFVISVGANISILSAHAIEQAIRRVLVGQYKV